MQLRKYVKIIQRRLWLILLAGVICSGVTFAINKLFIPTVYQASALMQVNGALTSNPASSSNDAYNNQNYAVSDSLLITSGSVLEAVAKKLPGVNLSQLQHAVSASPQANTAIIQVRAQASNPQLAMKIANTVVNVFIQQQVNRLTAPLKSQDTQIAAQLSTTQTALNLAQAQLSAMQASNAPVDAIANQNNIVNTYQANYNSLLTQQQQNQTKEYQIASTLTIQQPATAPEQPGSPSTLLNTTIAGALGLIWALALVLLLDWWDTSIQTLEDVTNLARLEPLESVPLSKHPLLFVDKANVSEARDKTIEQAFTVMAISTNSSMQNQGLHVALVAGLRTDAGTTTTATNLAISLAYLGRRVLLVDTNLQQPSLHEIFHCSNARGLINILADVHQFNGEMIQSWLDFWHTNIPNLWLLPVGTATNYPPVMQTLPQIRLLINHVLGKNHNRPDAESSVDIIIFDAPALSEGVDTIALASVTDCSILVVDAGKERGEMVNKAGALLQRIGSSVLGVVVNRQAADHRSYLYTHQASQKAAFADNLSLEETLKALLTKSTDGPQSQPQENRQNGLAGPPQSRSDGNPTVTNFPPTYTPLPKGQQGFSNSGTPSWKQDSSGN